MEHVVIEEEPALERPVLVVAFRGWNDAGEAASAALDHVAEAWGARRFAHLDPEEFFDFQVTRPTVRLIDGTTRHVDWPAPEFRAARTGGRDVVLLSGTEPNLRWRTFATTIVDAVRGLGTTRVVTLGAFLADVAHFRPVPIVGSASTPEEAARLGLPPSNYQGPTGIIGVLHDVANRMGVPSVSFWAAVPHYLPMGENPKAALALTNRLATYLGTSVDTRRLERTTAMWEEAVAEQVRDNKALADYLEQFDKESAPLPAGPDEGDELAAEIERFLQQRSGGAEE